MNVMKRLPSRILPALLLLAAASPAAATRVTLHGSHGSMVRQHGIARANDYTFLHTPAAIRAFTREGYLVPVPGNRDYRLAGVSFAVARPETKTFVERLGAAYHVACGAPLVVTSLTRPTDEQPRNASPLSVHPAGMAVDLRVPATSGCRRWLERSLLALERNGVLDVTREHRPPHYHVAVFPGEYMRFAASAEARDAAERAHEAALPRAFPAAAAPAGPAPPPGGNGRGRALAAIALLGLPGIGVLAFLRRRRT